MVIAISVASFILCFSIIQYRVKRFIYRRIARIYEDVSLLESSNFEDREVATDMRTLKQQVERFARIKKTEIETLQIRENYRKEFLGNISHELKTPLFTVQGYIDTLIDGAHKDKVIRKKYLERAQKGVERLTYIVKDMDMITRLEVGDMSLDKENFDIINLVKQVFDQFEMKASKKNISLVFDMNYDKNIVVNADQERILQVVANLIMNSIKYGKQNGTTEVAIEDLINNKVIVRVTDNGEGIKPEFISRLFERFFRVDRTGSRKEGGSGLGLAIVKHIVEAHGERVYVDSELGIGSEFSFTLEKVSLRTEDIEVVKI
ncbi:MAG: two-component system phosphate regulon sensor histidine kinase PhoR [Nonlabens sp.]|jgi:two-component system phosphate regulon sensor histidine kinase PhoR